MWISFLLFVDYNFQVFPNVSGAVSATKSQFIVVFSLSLSLSLSRSLSLSIGIYDFFPTARAAFIGIVARYINVFKRLILRYSITHAQIL